MWMYITHRGSLRATDAVAVMLSGHTTVWEAFFFGKVRHSFWNVYRNNRTGSVHSNAVGMSDCGPISEESQSSQTVGCLGRVSQISNMLFNKLIMMLRPGFQQYMYFFSIDRWRGL